MRYELIRLVVVPKQQVDLFIPGPPKDAPETRTAFLERAFEQPREFRHHGTRFKYRRLYRDASMLAAEIARENPETVRRERSAATPLGDEEWEVEKVEDWDLANVIIDLAPEAQVAYVHSNREVGRPIALMRTLCDLINSDASSYWDIVPNTMPSSDEFFSIAHQYIGSITEIEFVYTVPNIVFTISDAMNGQLKKIGRSTNAQEVVASVRNKEGAINPDGEEIKDGAEAVENGVAKSKIRIRGGKTVYDSRKHKKTLDMPDNIVISDLKDDSFVGFLRRFAGKWR